jgi:hypothetical protein
VVWNYGPRIRLTPTQDHVADGLSAENEAGTFQSGADITAGEIGGELGHASGLRAAALSGFYLDEFLTGLGGNRIAGLAAILDVKLDGLADFGQRQVTVVSLAHAAGKSRDNGHVTAVFFAFKDNSVAHIESPES